MSYITNEQYEQYPKLFELEYCYNCNNLVDFVYKLEELFDSIFNDWTNEQVNELLNENHYDLGTCDSCYHSICIDGEAKLELNELINKIAIDISNITNKLSNNRL